MLKKMSIRARLLIGFGTAILLSTIVILLSIAGLQTTRSRYEALINGPMGVVDEIKEARIHINVIARLVRDMNLNADRSTYAATEASIQEKEGQLATLVKSIQAGYTADDSHAADWADAIERWEESVSEVVSIIKSGDSNRAANMIVSECTPALEDLNEQAIQATNSMTTVRDAAQDSVEAYTMRTVILIIGLLVFNVIALVLFSIRITRSITVPLSEMKEVMTAMSEGDLHTPCAYEADDELGQTADALRASQSILAAIIDELNVRAAQLASGDFSVTLGIEFPGDLHGIADSFANLVKEMSGVMGSLKTAGDQVSAGADQVSSGAQALAQGATEQASSVEELSATINDISTAAQRNADTATQARVLADDAGSAIEQSNVRMQEMLGAMEDISRSSSEISKIIKTIEDIAFQTNILALNAAVEAARAGSAGKGFAVVADEVRNLASKSAEASKNTAALIEQSIRAVERGTSLAGDTAGALKTASEKAHEAVAQIDLIAEAVSQEASSIEQITIGIDQISAVVQTNSATSEESAAASEELSSQAQLMHNLLSKFKLYDGLDGGFASGLPSQATSDFGGGYDVGGYDSGAKFDKY